LTISSKKPPHPLHISPQFLLRPEGVVEKPKQFGYVIVGEGKLFEDFQPAFIGEKFVIIFIIVLSGFQW
jgi:hypothetical protein